MTADVRARTAAHAAPPTSRIEAYRLGAVDAYAVGGPRKRVAALRLFWDGGVATEPPRMLGAQAVATHALALSAAADGPAPLAECLESLGVTLAAGATETSSHLDLRGLREALPSALRMVLAALRRPHVEEHAFQAALATVRHLYSRRHQDTHARAVDALRVAHCGPRSGLARTSEDVLAALAGLCRVDVQRVAGGMAHRHLHAVVVGDRPEPYLAELATWAPASSGGASWPPVTRRDHGDGDAGHDPLLAHDPPAQVTVAAPAPRQAGLLWGAVVPIDGPGDQAVLDLATHALGGWSGARWHRLLREELGLTYGTSVSVTTVRYAGQTLAVPRVFLSVVPSTLAPTARLLHQQAAELRRHPLDAEELARAATHLVRTEAFYGDTARKLMDRTAPFLQAGLGPDFAGARLRELRTVDAGRVAERLATLLCSPTLVVVSEGAAP
ncbi:MAG TPA: insulinase family protein [Micromonosporaceae bacterium]|nr:insulinase family protein [Micromonosporaceae bacterium]